MYDNSHHQGKAPIGAMIAFNEDGFMKSMYRRYNINSNYNKKTAAKQNEFQNNNDYLMMDEVLRRRLIGKNSSNYPDLIIIDGGKGHLNIALSVLENLKIDNIEVLAISKGIKRDSGRENFYTQGIDKFSFSSDGNSTSIGALSVGRQYGAGQSSTTHGYQSGNNSFSNVIDKFPFASDTDATDVGDLSLFQSNLAGTSSTSSGYAVAQEGIDKFSFSSDGNASDIGDLSVNRHLACGQQY